MNLIINEIVKNFEKYIIKKYGISHIEKVSNEGLCLLLVEYTVWLQEEGVVLK